MNKPCQQPSAHAPKRNLGKELGIQTACSAMLAAAMGLASSGCQFKPETRSSKAETAATGPEGSGPTLTNRIASGGIDGIYKMLSAQIVKKELLLPTINHPHVMRLATSPQVSSDQWKSDIQSVREAMDASKTSDSPKDGPVQSYDLFCSGWFDLYTSGQQQGFKAANNTNQQVLAMQQVKYCMVAEPEKKQPKERFTRALLGALQAVKSWCTGNKKAKPFAMHRSLEVTFHAAVMNRPDLFICSPWTSEEQGNINLMGTLLQYSYKRTCHLSCPSTSSEVACSLAEQAVQFNEYAAYPTPQFLKRTEAHSGTGADESCEP
jgi:hypothetical protein